MRFLIVLMLSICAVNAQAINCPHGSILKGRYGGEFCIYTKRGMNWWSAYQWCASQGLRLATPAEACNYDEYSWTSWKCSNLYGKNSENITWVWVNYIASPGKAYVVNIGNADVLSSDINMEDYRSPLCVE